MPPKVGLPLLLVFSGQRMLRDWGDPSAPCSLGQWLQSALLTLQRADWGEPSLLDHQVMLLLLLFLLHLFLCLLLLWFLRLPCLPSDAPVCAASSCPPFIPGSLAPLLPHYCRTHCLLYPPFPTADMGAWLPVPPTTSSPPGAPLLGWALPAAGGGGARYP